MTLLMRHLRSQRRAASSEPFWFGFDGSDSSGSGYDVVQTYGANFTLSSWALGVNHLNQLQADGMKGLVWLGAYLETCQWELPDSTIISTVTAMKDHPALWGYYVGDEPGRELDQLGCPADTMYQARHDLIKSIDPNATTFTTLARNHQYDPWVGILDMYGIVTYPINNVTGYGTDKIPSDMNRAINAGMTRLMAVVQDFGDSFYVLPSAAQTAQMLNQWDDFPIEGAWVWTLSTGSITHSDVEANPAKQSAYSTWVAQQ